MSNIQKQHKISPAIAWLTIQKFIIFYCPLDGEHTRKQKKWMGLYMTLVLIATVGATTVFAAGDPLSVINNLSTFIFSLIRAIGLILLGFGVVQVGLSLKSHDPSQRANGFLTLAGGVIITFAKEILDLIMA